MKLSALIGGKRRQAVQGKAYVTEDVGLSPPHLMALGNPIGVLWENTLDHGSGSSSLLLKASLMK